LQLRLLEQGDELRRQRPAALQTNVELKALWEQYKQHDLNTTELLEGCVEVYFRLHREDYRSFVGNANNTDEDNREDQQQLYLSIFE